MQKLLVFILTCTFITGIKAQEVDYQKAATTIDEFATQLLEEFTMVPGISLSVVTRDGVVLSKGYGYADPGQGIQSTAETSFYIASVTKSFVGLLALILESEGKMDLDAPLTTYKPFRNLDNRPIFENVTIRELLNHTSGLSNDYITFRDAYTGQKSQEIMTMLLEEKTIERKEGKTFSYDNLGYNIFDILLKAELNKDWRDLLQEKLFEPLNMKHTSAYISKGKAEKWSMAWPYNGFYSYTPTREGLMKNDNMMQAAGGLLCSAEDAAQWMRFYLNEGKWGSDEIYASDLIRESLEPTAVYQREREMFHDSGYGVGWISADYKGESVNYHFGGFVGFFSHISIMPEQGLGVAAFANEAAFGDNVSNLIASFAYDILLGEVNEVADYDDRIQALRERVDRVQKGMNDHYEEIMAREWKLKKPNPDYAGTYENKYIGTVVVQEAGDELKVELGPLNAIATAYTKPNTIRVDFGYGGNVIKFVMKRGKVTGLEAEGEFFDKIE